MDAVTDIEIERLLKQNEKLLSKYLNRRKELIRKYVMQFEKEKRLMALKDLITMAQTLQKEE